MKTIIIISTLAILACINCGTDQILDNGIYEVTAKITDSDWGVEVGHSSTRFWNIGFNEGEYSIQIEQNDWRFRGGEEYPNIVLDYHQDLEDSKEDCDNYNHLHIVLTPGKKGQGFVGITTSEYHSCNMTSCWPQLPIPECEPREISLWESYNIEGKLEK